MTKMERDQTHRVPHGTDYFDMDTGLSDQRRGGTHDGR